MASERAARLGKITAFTGGAVGIGIVLYALLLTEPLGDGPAPMATIKTTTSKTQTAGIADPAREAAPSIDTQEQEPSDATDVVAPADSAEPTVATADLTEPEADATDASSAPVVDTNVAEAIALAPNGTPVPDIAELDSTVPSFDLVRVDAQGGAVIAGRAEPNAKVSVMQDGEAVATATANQRGEFVAMLDMEVEKSAQSLSLSAQIDGGPMMTSSDTVIVLGREVRPGNASDEELSPAIVQTTDDDIRIIQPVIGLADLTHVSLDSISYDDIGDVVLTGRGRPTYSVRIYAGLELVGEAKLSDQGTWKVNLSNMNEGRYTLRVDEVTAEGDVVSRVESPFQRVFPSPERLALLKDDKQVVVQPGNNLWTIARLRYGEGIKYTVIFDANRTLIRDPDLIFPGQVFALPKN